MKYKSPDPTSSINRGLVGYMMFHREKPDCCFHGHFANMLMWGRPLSIKEIERIHKDEKAVAMQPAVKRVY